MPMLLSMLCLCCLLKIKDSWFLIPDYYKGTAGALLQRDCMGVIKNGLHGPYYKGIAWALIQRDCMGLITKGLHGPYYKGTALTNDLPSGLHCIKVEHACRYNNKSSLQYNCVSDQVNPHGYHKYIKYISIQIYISNFISYILWNIKFVSNVQHYHIQCNTSESI